MKAIVWTKYGPPEVLQLKEVEKPTPNDHEVLIRIYATAATMGDCEQRSLSLPILYRLAMRAYLGLTGPKRVTILGMNLAGDIESVGKGVKRFSEGDPVFAATGFASMGTYAEYICLPEEPEEGALARKPNNMTYEEAAAVPSGALDALCLLREGNIKRGQKVLINGAGGTIGTFAIQLAKYFGAEVTGVDSTRKLEMLRSIGADQVIDYTQADFTSSGGSYDAILDVVGKGSFSGSLRSLNQHGRFIVANPRLSHSVLRRWTSMTSRRRVIIGNARYRTKDLVYLKELIEAGHIRSVIDRCYPMEQTAEAHRYVETGQKAGHVVITVAHDSKRQ